MSMLSDILKLSTQQFDDSIAELIWSNVESEIIRSEIDKKNINILNYLYPFVAVAIIAIFFLFPIKPKNIPDIAPLSADEVKVKMIRSSYNVVVFKKEKDITIIWVKERGNV